MTAPTDRCPRCGGTWRVSVRDGDRKYIAECPDCAKPEADHAADCATNDLNNDSGMNHRCTCAKPEAVDVEAAVERVEWLRKDSGRIRVCDNIVADIRALAAELHKTKTVCDIIGKENEQLKERIRELENRLAG